MNISAAEPHICSLACMYHRASRFIAFSTADRVPCAHNLFACYCWSSVFSHMLSSSLSTQFLHLFFLLLHFALRYFLHSPVESGVCVSDIQIIWKTQSRGKKTNRRSKKAEEKNSITIFVNNLIERQANHHFLLNIATETHEKNNAQNERKITIMSTKAATASKQHSTVE